MAELTISMQEWRRYSEILKALSDTAAAEFRDALFKANGYFKGMGLKAPRDAIIELAYGLVTKYGEGAASAACLAYDAIAELSGVSVPAAIPAQTATIGEVAKAVNGTIKTGNDEIVSGAIGRLVKLAGQDTTLQNAKRDGAQFAWVVRGDTCAFCITLASRGWQYASAQALKDGHAEHVHANCDCAYAVRFNENTKVEGYDPDKYLAQYRSAEGNTPDQKINAMRRRYYEENKERINAQKRDAYQRRKELNSSAAEETNVN